MKIDRTIKFIRMIIPAVLLMTVSLVFLSFIGYYLISTFPNTSYRVITIFIILIIISNIYAKICIYVINCNKHEKNHG